MELAKKLDAASGNVLLKQNCLCSMMTPTLSKLYDLQLEAAQKIEQLMWEKDEIIAAINAVDNQTYRIILVSRYLNGEAWPDIAAELNYDLRHVYRLHNAALEATVTAYSIYGYTTTSSVMWKSRKNGWTMSRTLAHRTKMSKKKRHSRLLDYADLQITLARTH